MFGFSISFIWFVLKFVSCSKLRFNAIYHNHRFHTSQLSYKNRFSQMCRCVLTKMIAWVLYWSHTELFFIYLAYVKPIIIIHVHCCVLSYWHFERVYDLILSFNVASLALRQPYMYATVYCRNHIYIFKGFTCLLFLYPSKLLHWHWGNRTYCRNHIYILKGFICLFFLYPSRLLHSYWGNWTCTRLYIAVIIFTFSKDLHVYCSYIPQSCFIGTGQSYVLT